MKTQTWKICLIVLSLAIVGCSDDERTQATPAPAPESQATAQGWKQIERLGRPAINEALVIDNDLLNAFNSIPPTADLSEAAAPVVAQIVSVLDAVDGLDGKEDITAEAVAAAFFPDVMRIDVSASLPGVAYNGCASSKLILCGGRKIEDDVIDITLSLVVAGDPSGGSVGDSVAYEGEPGNPAQPGHRAVLAAFPFVPAPH